MSSYILNISATDGGVPPLSGHTLLHLTVLDINDNGPVFASHPNEVFLPENSPNDSFVAQVSASDGDATSNADIAYSITQGNEEEVFHMDRNSGILSVHAALDFEQTKSYLLQIEARDMGEPQLSAQILVITLIYHDSVYTYEGASLFFLCLYS